MLRSNLRPLISSMRKGTSVPEKMVKGPRVGWSGQEACVIGHLKVWERGDTGRNQSSLDDSGMDVDKPELSSTSSKSCFESFAPGGNDIGYQIAFYFYLYGSKSQITICIQGALQPVQHTTPSDITPSIQLWKNFPEKNPFNSWAASAVIRYVEPETWKENRTHKHRRGSAAFTQTGETNTPSERETL